ncbi:MAG: FecR family protein [Bacteroidota bacterium]
MGEREFYSEQNELLITYLTGMAGETERKAALAWIHESAENRRYFDELKEIYKAAKSAQDADQYETSLSWEKVKARYYKEFAARLRDENRETKLSFIRAVLKYAAIIALAVAIGHIGFRFFKNRSSILSGEIWNTIEAPYGSRTRVTLSDGSKVWLNAGSNLKYSSRFGQENRKVILDGEAYFSVTRDTTSQFTVSTSHLDIKVYGTEFNVEAYSTDDYIRTTLVSGAITLEGDLISRAGKRSISLLPNQSATYYIQENKRETVTEAERTEVRDVPRMSLRRAENLIVTPDINPVLYTSWKDPVWHIDGETLQSLSTKFERRFNIEFVLDSKSIQNYKFSGKLKDEPLELVLNILRLSLPIDYKIQNNQVVISENKYFRNSYDEMLIRKTN